MNVLDPITGQPAAIRYEGVHKSFGEHRVLRGLDLVIPRGRITFLVGSSGTGKSVTLRLAVGLLLPDRGRVWVDDDELTTMAERRRVHVRDRFGVVFQHGALFDSMTVFDNVAFPLREHSKMGSAEVRRRVEELLAQVGLGHAGRKMPHELSGGMRKRVGLARALAREPHFILYDEPTTGLDPILSTAMDELIRDTHRSRPDVTTVVISHDMHAVLHIADKVVMLDQGRVRHEATPGQLTQIDDPMLQQFLRMERLGTSERAEQHGTLLEERT